MIILEAVVCWLLRYTDWKFDHFCPPSLCQGLGSIGGQLYYTALGLARCT